MGGRGGGGDTTDVVVFQLHCAPTLRRTSKPAVSCAGPGTAPAPSAVGAATAAMAAGSGAPGVSDGHPPTAARAPSLMVAMPTWRGAKGIRAGQRVRQRGGSALCGLAADAGGAVQWRGVRAAAAAAERATYGAGRGQNVACDARVLQAALEHTRPHAALDADGALWQRLVLCGRWVGGRRASARSEREAENAGRGQRMYVCVCVCVCVWRSV